MTIKIRSMTISDYEAALELWERTAGMGLSKADEKLEIQHFLEQNEPLCFVAYEEERLVGTILCGQDGRRGYLYHLAVDMDYRFAGIGKELVQRSITALKKLGIQKCHLFVYMDNTSGIAFWDHLGWVTREDIQVMSLDL